MLNTDKAVTGAGNVQREKAKQRGLWQRRHRLNVVEREELVALNRKHGVYTGPQGKPELQKTKKASASQNRVVVGGTKVDWPAKCNLCGKSAHFTTLGEASAWVADHGCNYGKASAAPESDAFGNPITPENPLVDAQTILNATLNRVMEAQGKPEVPQALRHHEYGMDVRNLTKGQLVESYSELKAHSKALAEALRNAADWLSRSTRIDDQEQAQDAREVLAQYDTDFPVTKGESSGAIAGVAPKSGIPSEALYHDDDTQSLSEVEGDAR